MRELKLVVTGSIRNSCRESEKPYSLVSSPTFVIKNSSVLSGQGDRLREEFLEFVSCKHGVNGRSFIWIYIYILVSTLRKAGPDWNYIRRQGYTMAQGQWLVSSIRVQARIQASCPLALYVHCSSHKLSLSVVAIYL